MPHTPLVVTLGLAMAAILLFANANVTALIDGVSGGRLKLHYRGRSQSLFRSVPVEHARWFAGIVGQLTDDQLRDAFRAAVPHFPVSGFTNREMGNGKILFYIASIFARLETEFARLTTIYSRQSTRRKFHGQ